MSPSISPLRSLLLTSTLLASTALGNPAATAISDAITTHAPTPTPTPTTTCGRMESVCVDYFRDCFSTTLTYGGCTTHCPSYPIAPPTSTPLCPGHPSSTLEARGEPEATCTTVIYDGVKTCAETSFGFGGTITRCPGETSTQAVTTPACPEESAGAAVGRRGDSDAIAVTTPTASCQYVTYDAVRDCGSTTFWYGGVGTRCPGQPSVGFTTAPCPTPTAEACETVVYDGVKTCAETTFGFGGTLTRCPGDVSTQVATTPACPEETGAAM